MSSPRAWSSLVFPLWLLACSGSHSVRHCDTDDPDGSPDAGERADGSIAASDAGRPDAAADAGAMADADTDAAPHRRACESGQACKLRELFRYERPAWLAGASFVDANGDGRSDVLTSYVDSNLSYLELMHEDGSLAPAVGIATGRATAHAVGDFDADGIADLAVIWQTKLSIFRGDGQAHFTGVFEHTFTNPLLAISAGRADGDATDDLVLVTGANGADLPVSMFIARFAGKTPSFGNEVSLPALKDGGLALFSREGNAYVIAGTQAAVWPVASDGTIGTSVPLPSPEGIFGAGVAKLDGDDYLDIYALLDPVDGKSRIGVWFADKDGFAQAPTIVETPQNAWPHRMNAYATPQDQLVMHFGDGFHSLGFSDRATFQLGPAFGDLRVWTDDARVLGVPLNMYEGAMLVASGLGKMLVRLGNPLRTLHADLAQPVELIAQDFTRDGRLDLVANTRSTWGDLALFENNPVTGLMSPRSLRLLGDTAPPLVHPTSIDSDGDGYPEIFTTCANNDYNADLAQLTPGTGDVAFGTKLAFGYNSVLGTARRVDGFDMDGDGLPELIEQFDQDLAVWPGGVRDRQAPNVLWLDQPGPYGTLQSLNGVPPIMADLDGDGARELIFARYQSLWQVEYDAAKQQLVPVQSWVKNKCWPRQLAQLDMDADGRDDVLMRGSCGEFESSRIYWLRANGKGLDATPHELELEGLAYAGGMVHADLDGDGADELIVLDPPKTLRVYHNLGGARFEAGESIELAARDLPLTVDHATLLSGDFTGDGQDEIVVHLSGYTTPDVVVMLQNHVVD